MAEKKQEYKKKTLISQAGVLKDVIDFPKYKEYLFWKGSNIDYDPKEWNKTAHSKLEQEFDRQKSKEKNAFCQKQLNTIRFKKKIQKQEDKQNEKNYQSNASIVEWDDGSYGLIIGQNHYELQKDNFFGQLAISSKSEACDNILVVQDTVDKKLVIKPKTQSKVNLD